ncbi:MAG: hypothetical protein WD004_00640 [Actinomycetota bacterium]
MEAVFEPGPAELDARKLTRRAVVGATIVGAGAAIATAISKAAGDVQVAPQGSTSGAGVIGSGCQHATVRAGVSLSEDALVLCTLQSHPGGKAAIQHVEVDATDDTFTVFLTGEVSGDTKFAWSLVS